MGRFHAGVVPGLRRAQSTPERGVGVSPSGPALHGHLGGAGHAGRPRLRALQVQGPQGVRRPALSPHHHPRRDHGGDDAAVLRRVLRDSRLGVRLGCPEGTGLYHHQPHRLQHQLRVGGGEGEAVGNGREPGGGVSRPVRHPVAELPLRHLPAHRPGLHRRAPFPGPRRVQALRHRLHPDPGRARQRDQRPCLQHLAQGLLREPARLRGDALGHHDPGRNRPRCSTRGTARSRGFASPS